MKNFKFMPVLGLSLLCLTVFISSCNKDGDRTVDTDYQVNVEIVSPSTDATIAAGDPFTVEVDYSREGQLIHNISIEIVDANGAMVEKLVERHAHVADEFTFKQEGIVINQAGNYKVRAMTTDLHTGEEEHEESEEDNNLVEQNFVIQ